jgi:hypothetical protein
MPAEVAQREVETPGLPEVLKALNACYLDMRKQLIAAFPGGDDGYSDTQRTAGGKHFHLQFGWYEYPPRSKT